MGRGEHASIMCFTPLASGCGDLENLGRIHDKRQRQERINDTPMANSVSVRKTHVLADLGFTLPSPRLYHESE